MLTQAVVHKLFEYDAATGDLINRTSRHYKVSAGSVAGCISAGGYRAIKIKQKRYTAHRLVWLYVHGVWPTHEIDHLNGNPADNRIENLRDVPHQLNVQNLRAPTSSSSTGLLGVGPKGNKWRARIGVNGIPRTIGTYSTKDEALAAYINAKRELHAGCTI